MLISEVFVICSSSTVRSVNLSFDGKLLASCSEDQFAEIAYVESGEQVAKIPCRAVLNTMSWNPKRHLLAFAGDDLDNRNQESGKVTLMGVPAI